jgi:hypothetical protein
MAAGRHGGRSPDRTAAGRGAAYGMKKVLPGGSGPGLRQASPSPARGHFLASAQETVNVKVCVTEPDRFLAVSVTV